MQPLTAQTTNKRLHALDAIRATALLLGIVLHATMSFQIGLAEVGWPLADSDPSRTLDVAFFVIHVFRMSVFFLIAGFFAHAVMHRRGMGAFIKDRLRRIALPLAIFWPICITGISAAMIWGAFKLNGGTLPEAPPAPAEPTFPLTHLWFLYLLLWLYAIALVLRTVIAKLDSNQKFRTTADLMLRVLTSSPLLCLLLSIPVSLALVSIPEWFWWGGVPTPDQSLKPLLSSTLVYFYVFTLGWLIDRQREILTRFQQHWHYHLLIGVIAIIACLGMAGTTSDFVTVASGTNKLIYAASYGIALISTTFAFIGAGMRFFSSENWRIRYLADGSYWIYLMHLPLVMALQALMMDSPWHWSFKFVLINVATFVPLIISYRYLVRYRWLGKLLNGKRAKRNSNDTAVVNPQLS